jgi:hypothetical protein
MGIIGSFLLSNFSLAVVTNSPNPTGALYFVDLVSPLCLVIPSEARNLLLAGSKRIRRFATNAKRKDKACR